MLLFPDFYKVAVSSAGNHDQPGYLYSWGERYQGQVNGANYDQAENGKLAANLKGKLLLAVCLWKVGLTDENPESSPLPKGAQEVFGHKNFFAAFWSPIRFIA